MMGLHKLTAGDGYLYLIRQVAAADATDRGRPSLADYYSSKGETPGRWMGRGLPSLGCPVGRDFSDPLIGQLWSVPDGSQVREDQMKALFGEGLHPNADQITRHLTGVGVAKAGALAGARLGRPFRVGAEENEWTRRLRAAYSDYNTTIGEDRTAPIADAIRARIRTAVAREMFDETYGRPPQDDRELSGFVARQSRAQTTAVAGYDLTFTPVKSVSVLWGLAPRSIARVIEECHHQAVAESIAFIEDHAAFSRMGADGIAQVNTTGLIAAAFDHRDSRAGDPNLHTHVAVSNKVQAISADGIPRWLALDGTPLHKAAVAASELYNTRLEALLIERARVQFADAADTKPGKRPVREIVGIPTGLTDTFSSRRAAIEHRVGQLAKQFQTEHGREPSVVEMLALSQQATLETRQAKHEPRSLAEQRHTWRTQAIEVLGSQRKLSKLIADISGHNRGRRRVAITKKWVHEQAAAVIANVAETRSTWQVNHIRAEAQRLLRYLDHPGGPEVVNRIIATALGEHSIAITTHADTEMDEPAALRRRDGASVYTGHDTTTYTSADVMAAERRILAAAAAKRGGRVVDDASIGLALLEAHAQHGFELNDGQQQLVKTMATSGARLQLALAPAGTGKTTAMGALAAGWRNAGGNVIGLAPTASAAEVLAEDTGVTTDTMAKFVQLAEPAHRRSGPPPAADDPARKWFKTIGPKSLLIVDEAGKASTFDLDAVIGHALARGASVRLVGDDQQLASISAGGVISDIAARHETLTLSTVVRFADPAESAASLALRDGDPAGIAYYIDNGRVHVGADQTAADMAYHAWAADVDAGKDSILLAPTNEQVAELNERARLDRLTKQAAASATVTLGDGLTASAGDWIATRKNARWLRLTSSKGWVKNGHRWVIRRVNRDGSVTVSPLRGRIKNKTVRLPADYISAHTTLGYASTVDSAQGITAGSRDIEGTCHIVGSDRLTRQQLYVAGTRGKNENHIYFSTAEADPHHILAPKATHPPTAVDILSAILRRDGAQVSAHTAQAAEHDPFTRLHPAAAMYADALTAAAEYTAGPKTMADIDAAAGAIRANIHECAAWPVLRRNLALLAIDGHDPIDALRRAASTPLGNPIDVAAVLDWRLQPAPGSAAERVGPLRWLAVIPHTLTQHPQWGPYLAARSELVTELADRIRATARDWQLATVPPWARPLLADQPELMAEIAVFRAAHNVDPADTRITGPEQHANRSAAIQQLFHGRVDAALRLGEPGAQRWRSLGEGIDAHITTDPYWPKLATHLDQAARAGADVAALLTDAIERHGSLPDELPAAALWWRLSGTLEPPTLAAANTGLRPAWTPELHRLLGSPIAETVIADPAWPSLVTAVAASGWPPRDLLAAAAEHLRDIAETEHLRPDEYARLLTYRIELLTHHAATIDTDIPHPAEAAQQAAAPTEPGEQLDLFNDVEPPPDPDDYPYSYAEDTLDGLDFTDLPRHRPTSPAAGVDADIAALRTQRDAAHAHAAQLTQAILRGKGPAEVAAAGELAKLNDRHQQQLHYQHNLAHAHGDWVSAEHTAEIHRALLDHLAAQISTADNAGDDALAATYRARRDQLGQHTGDIDAAVGTTRQRLDAARTALIDAAGGAENIVTERDIQARRAEAQRADIDALTQARAHARELNNQLARAEAAAGRAFADARENQPHANVDLAAEISVLRSEVEVLEAAGGRAPASMYRVPEPALASLDEESSRAVIAIANSAQAIEPLQLGEGADKPAVLGAIAAAAHHHQHRILALPATDAAATYAGEHRYADTTTNAAAGRDNLETGRWSLPIGSLVIVDDAEHLPPDQLRWLIDNAAATNTKLLLISTPDERQAAHTLTDALHQHLPWAQQLGETAARQRPTAIAATTSYLAATTGRDVGDDSDARRETTELLARHDDLANRYRATIERAGSRDHGQHRDESRDTGLGL
jgi:conjugative relaxase-like TrwC/TraI family protein